MNLKISLVLIALMGVGLFALPQTTALFAGQHSFTNIDATGNQIDCAKCHGDVSVELGSGHSGVTGTDGPHADFKCEYCHRIAAGSSSGDNAYGRITYKDTQTNTTASRVLIVPVTDMESGNIPATILVGDNVTTAESRTAFNGAASSTPSGNGASFSLSNCLDPKTTITSGCTNPTLVLNVAKPDMRLVSTYYPNGTAKDNNSLTAMSGLDIGKITFTSPTAPTATKGASVTDILTNAGSRAVNPGSSYHAASLVSCMECHRGEEPMGHYSRVVDGTSAYALANNGSADCSNCHYGSGSGATGESGIKMTTLWAGGFGLTNMTGDSGRKEAHMSFVTANDSGITTFEYGANNGACVACHTHVAVDITYNKATTYQFTSTVNGSGYDVGSFTTGPNTTSVHVTGQ